MTNTNIGVVEDASNALDETLLAAIASIHETGALAVLADPLARPEEVDSAIEPLADAVFKLERAGTWVDRDDVMGELGMVVRPDDGDAIHVCERVDRELERAQDDGQALFEITRGLLLLFDGPEEAAKGLAEWCKWSAITDDDLTAEGLEIRVHDAARCIMRQMLARDPIVVPAEAAWPTISGFRQAGLPIGRGTYRWALIGAKAGAEDHRSNLEAAREAEAWRASQIAGALAQKVAA